MNLFKRGSLLIGLLAVASAAHAQFSSTITGTTQYDFRGISLSADDPALQASLDYAFANGFAVGAWASNIDYGPDFDGDIELDLYASYSRDINEKASWNAGIVWYTYPGSSSTETRSKIESYPELSLGFVYDMFTFKQWYTWDYAGLDENAFYTEANVRWPLPQNFFIVAHVGYSYGDAFEDIEYWDYAAGVGVDWKNFMFLLRYVDTSGIDGPSPPNDVFQFDGRAIFSVSTTLPWGE
jgi:uncharacterized protein (TIGR02001 family)